MAKCNHPQSTPGQGSHGIARRWFLQQCGMGLGAVALNQLLGSSASALDADPLAAKAPHFAPKAKHIIYLFMAGAPSQFELLDYKPELVKFDGTLPPPELLKNYRAAFINPNSRLLGPRFNFAQHGQAGAWVSELLPHFTEIIDDVTIIKSMSTDALGSGSSFRMILVKTPRMRSEPTMSCRRLRPDTSCACFLLRLTSGRAGKTIRLEVR